MKTKASHSNGALQTLKFPDELDRIIGKIVADAKLAEQEMGMSTLFLSFGFRRERVRLWYVAATRARDLLILPRHSAALSDKCWAKLVDLGIADLTPIKLEDIGIAKERMVSPQENGQTREIFAAACCCSIRECSANGAVDIAALTITF